MRRPVVEMVGDDDAHREQAILARMYSNNSNLGQIDMLNRLTDPGPWFSLPIDARLVGTPRAYGGGEGVWISDMGKWMDHHVISVDTPELVLHVGSVPRKEEASEDVEEVFNALMDKWRGETEHMSSTSDILLHPAHFKITGLGPKAVPLLLRELRDRPYHLFSALSAITREDLEIPEGKGRVKRLTEAWLAWGRQRGYL